MMNNSNSRREKTTDKSQWSLSVDKLSILLLAIFLKIVNNIPFLLLTKKKITGLGKLRKPLQ